MCFRLAGGRQMEEAIRKLLGQWLDWILGPDPDNNNNGDPLWLAGEGCSYAQTAYKRIPVIRAGINRLSPIPRDKSIFIPVITSFVDSVDNACSDNEQSRRMSALNDINEGPVPTVGQIKIDGNPIALPGGDTNLMKYKVSSPQIFPLIAGGGHKLCLDVPIKPRSDNDVRPIVAAGYCLLLQKLQSGSHIITSLASGPRDYTTGLIYDIEIFEAAPKVDPPGTNPQLKSYEANLILELGRRHKQHEISKDDYERCIAALNKK